MVINSIADRTAAAREPGPVPMTNAQQVVIVDGSAEIMDEIETVLDAGHYDIVFVESTEHAYSQIKRVQPNLVILCVDLDEPAAFHVLSMLKLDHATRHITVLTYALEGTEPDRLDEEDLDASSAIFARPLAPVMN
jgi:PleD family two-component response regulator